MSETVLDRIDFEILEALQKDARLSNKELAAHVKLAPSSCLQRVRRLQAAGVLRGYHADVEPEALGIGVQAMIFVQLIRNTRDLGDSFQDHMLQLPEVVAVYRVGGVQDFLIHVAVRDAGHLRDFSLDSVGTREEIRHIETALIFEYSRAPRLPQLVPLSDENARTAMLSKS